MATCVDALRHERGDAAGEGALGGPGQLRAMGASLRPGASRPAMVVDDTGVAVESVLAVGERLVDEQVVIRTNPISRA